ncbi:hypothetical protein CPB84DRAFT_238879 [Gymnopilus junonius]|uniref:Uncharacterized protein n=1 Tax=Gymnopilus junonius TaxID=109634 RepID=A0A9P5TSI2_GYMJU|nr:hypothetical protein CPB84DRAFT_238879 [Gymnopilus junonius]
MSVSSSCEQSNILDLFLANIQLPALESLSFDLRRDGHSLSSTDLESFLSRSSCHLRELKITSRSENDNLFSVLQKTSHIKSLQLDTYQQSADKVNAFIQLLTKTSLTTNNDPERQALLQSLSMHISILDAKQFGWDIVPNIFGPPSKTGPKQRRPLRRLCLCLDRPNRDQLFTRLSPLFFHDSWSWRMTGLVCI